MLLHQRNLKHHVADKSRGRYALNTIALTALGTLSTDGHALMLVPYPDTDPKDAPKIDGVDPASSPPNGQPFLVSLEDAAKAASMVGRGKRNGSPFTELIQVEIEGDKIRFGATDLSNAQVLQAHQYEGAYPEVGAVIPDYSEAQAITINLSQLLRSLKALRGATDEEVVTIRIIDDQQAIGLSCKDGTALLVMPIRVESPKEHVPDQLAKLRDGPPVVAPAEPEDDEVGEESVPTEVEMEDAQEVFDSQPVLPSTTETAPVKRRRRRKATQASAELADLIGQQP